MRNPNPNYKKNIKPGLSIPAGLNAELDKWVRSVNEHLQGADGTKGQPKERFVTLDDLERAGLIKAGVKNGRGVITGVTTSTEEASSSAAASSLSSLTDVVMSGVLDGYTLEYDAATAQWFAVEPESATGFPPQLAWLGIR